MIGKKWGTSQDRQTKQDKQVNPSTPKQRAEQNGLTGAQADATTPNGTLAPAARPEKTSLRA
jgi:hypothetical protein